MVDLERRERIEQQNPYDLLPHGAPLHVHRIRLGDQLPPKNAGVDTLNHELVMRGMAVGNGLALYGPHGETTPLCRVDGQFQPSREVDGRIVTYPKNQFTGSVTSELMDKEEVARESAVLFVSVAGWGEGPTFMTLYNDGIPAIVDANEALLTKTLKDIVIIGKGLEEEGYVVSFGGCVSAANLEPPGLQSVLEPHTGLHATKKAIITPEHSRNIRKSTPWDNGLSEQLIGIPLVEVMNSFVFKREGGYRGNAEADPMGITAYIEGLTIEKLHERNEQGLRFINEFLRPLSHTIHAYYKEVCYEVFQGPDGEGLNLDTVIQYVLDASKNGKSIDVAEFNEKFFRLRKKRDDEPVWIEQFRELERQGKLRHPPGWAFNLQFDQNGAYLTVLSSFLKSNAGPAESLGRKLIRSQDEMPGYEREEVVARVHRAMERVFEEEPRQGDIFKAA